VATRQSQQADQSTPARARGPNNQPSRQPKQARLPPERIPDSLNHPFGLREQLPPSEVDHFVALLPQQSVPGQLLDGGLPAVVLKKPVSLGDNAVTPPHKVHPGDERSARADDVDLQFRWRQPLLVEDHASA